jgi:F0F1-type ATP synthase membrane subunit c/vacuolar-type H+-ATPase subunit K
MRAICGAIITAGAMIGLGLTAIGFGARYHTGLENVDKDGNPILLHLYQMDKPLVFIMVFMSATAIIGLGIAFVGLAYHHHRRHHEMLHLYGHTAGKHPAAT